MKKKITNYRLMKTIVFFITVSLCCLTDKLCAQTLLPLDLNKYFYSMESLSSVSCQKVDCVAVGRNSSDGTSHAIISISKDLGKSWSKPRNLPNPQNIKMSGLTSISCMNTRCVAVGAKASDNRSIFPLIMISQDKGYSWLIASIPSLNMKTEGFLSSVNCQDNLCAAVGTRGDKEGTKPIGYFSIDGGLDWSESLMPVLSVDSNARLWSVSCQEKNCLAIGGYYAGVDTDPIHDKPMALNSRDGGKTWFSPNILPPVGDESYVELTTVSCQKNHCSASGTYRNKDSMMRFPISYYSEDGGTNWAKPFVFDTHYNGTVRNGGIETLTCEKNYCIAIGSIEKSFFVSQLVTYVSENNGSTWSGHRPLIELPDMQNGFFLGITCKDQICIAVGENFYLNNYSSSSLITRSEDGGLNWSLSRLEKLITI